VGWSFTASACENKAAKADEFVSLQAWRPVKVALHVGKRKGKPKRIPKDSADVGINTVSETYRSCVSAAEKFRSTARLPEWSA
jgi:hypothetical protein